MKATRAILAVALLALIGGAGYYASRPSSGDAKKAPRSAAVPVTLARVEVRDVPLFLALTGRTEAFESVTLRPRVEGQIKSVDFAEGQHVAKGDVLLRLEATDFRARLDQVEANLARSRALATRAKADLERYQALRGKGFVSEEKVAEMRTALAAAEATTKADAAARDLAVSQLSYTDIRAPFPGIVGSKLVFPGAAVKANETGLATINRVRPLNVAFAVPEKYLPRLQAALRQNGRRLNAKVSLPGQVTAWDAEVRGIDNGVDITTGTILVRARMPNDDEALAPGQFVEVRLLLETLASAIVIPAEALQQGSDGSFVFVAKQDDGIEVRKVSLREVQNSGAIIASGLAAGEEVVVEGQLRLTPGARIRRSGGTSQKPLPAPGGSGSGPPQGAPGSTTSPGHPR